MDRIRDYLKNPMITAGVGLVIGLVFGLVVLGWWLWPVQYYDAYPEHLRQESQIEYLCMTIDSYDRSQNIAQALQRYQDLDPHSSEILALLTPELCGTTPQTSIDAFRILVNQPATNIPADSNASVDTSGTAAVLPQLTQTTTVAAQTESGGIPLFVIILMCLVTIAFGGFAAYYFLIRPKNSLGRSPSSSKAIDNEYGDDYQYGHGADAGGYEEPSSDEPVLQYVSSYKYGEDHFNDTIDIMDPSSEYLGNCGVSISEVIGVGSPKKVCALEVWLFDKGDIKTVTKIVMSEHAFNDQTFRRRLETKGELLLPQVEGRYLFETEKLQMEVRIVDIAYGRSPLPANSFFDRMILELNVWKK
ncbi:MAG TPA: hypothetical protein VN376_04275 [Longilinea sp.]|nr:hypothetical protein [Longilinea sp.]